MTTIKGLLLKQTADAFSGRPDMSLMASLQGITQEEASWRPDTNTPTAEQLVRHVAWAKSMYCHQGFGTPLAVIDESVTDIGDAAGVPWEFPCGAAWGCSLATGVEEAVRLLEQSHRVLAECLEACPEEALARPVPTRHGKSAANVFWILLMHDLYHAGQIRTRRTLCRAAAAQSPPPAPAFDPSRG
jgi:hypothetical protein